MLLRVESETLQMVSKYLVQTQHYFLPYTRGVSWDLPVLLIDVARDIIDCWQKLMVNMLQWLEHVRHGYVNLKVEISI